MDDDFGVRAGAENVPPGFERQPQLLKVINLAVKYDGDILFFVENRLVAAGEVNDTQAAHPHRRSPRSEARPGRSNKQPFVVGPAMPHSRHHPADDGLCHIASRAPHDPTDATHAITLPWIAEKSFPYPQELFPQRHACDSQPVLAVPAQGVATASANPFRYLSVEISQQIPCTKGMAEATSKTLRRHQEN